MPRKLAKIVAALAPLPALAAAGEALGQNPAHTFRFAEVDFAVIRFDPAKENLRLAWLGADGVPLSTYENLEKALNAEGKRIKFALNAGIYAGWEEPGGKRKKDAAGVPVYRPLGLHVQGGKELVPLNRDQPPQDSPEWGNFYLAPNGVFFIGSDGKAGVMETGEFARSGIKPMLAAQSGPLLLRGGQIHPKFREGSPNKRVRNGVGVDSGGRVVFASTRSAAVNFHTFARLFAELGCADALFLDGDFPEILIKPEGDVPGKARRLAGIFYVAEPIPEEKGGTR